MAAIDGTNLLIYRNGQVIAMQKGLTVSISDNLADATNKESAGWAEYINGLLNAKIDFDSLFSTGTMADSPAVLSAKDLMADLIAGSELLFSILGGPFPIVGRVRQSSLSFAAPHGQAMTLAGSFVVNGQMYALTGAMANLLTDPDGTSEDFDTFVHSGTAITSAITASAASCKSNSFPVTLGSTYKVACFFTKNSGSLPGIYLYEDGVDVCSNTAIMTEGLNFITFVATKSCTAILYIINGTAANWSTTPIYLIPV